MLIKVTVDIGTIAGVTVDEYVDASDVALIGPNDNPEPYRTALSILTTRHVGRLHIVEAPEALAARINDAILHRRGEGPYR